MRCPVQNLETETVVSCQPRSGRGALAAARLCPRAFRLGAPETRAQAQQLPGRRITAVALICMLGVLTLTLLCQSWCERWTPLLNMQLLGHPQCFVSYAEPWLTRFTSLILLPCLNVCGEYSFISSLSCSLIILLFTIIAVFNSNTLLLLRVFPLQWLWVQLGGLGGEWNFLPFLTGLQSNKFESLFYLNLLFQPTYAACGHD